MGQVPCEFWADWPIFIFQSVAPDMIWHIYSHLYCSLRDGGRDLLISGEAAPTMGKVLCEFQADWPGCSFSEQELRQGSFQPCPAQDGASSLASSSWCDLAHLLAPVLLIEGWWQGLAIFRGGSPYHGARVESGLKTHRGPAPWWVQHPLKMAISYHHPPWSSAGVSKCAKSHLELLAINEAPFIYCIYIMTKNFVAFDLPNVTIPLTALTE